MSFFRRRIVAVDADGVVYDHLSRICLHLRNRWNYIADPRSLLSKNPSRMTGIQEVDLDLVKQFKSPEFIQTVQPFPWAEEALLHLRTYADLILVSNRPNYMKETTYACCVRDFECPDSPTQSIFEEVHCYEHTAKWKAAKIQGATWAIDDNPVNADEYARHNIPCFLLGGPPLLRPHRYIKPCEDLRDVAGYFDKFFGRKTA